LDRNIELFTFSISHFSEKVRWILDVLGLPYQETRLVPFLHIPHNLRLTRGRGTSVPILRTNGEVIQDSLRITAWLEQNYRAEMNACGLIPANKALREEVLQIEKQSGRVGSHVTRFVYAQRMDCRDELLRLWGLDANFLQRAALRALFPIERTAFARVVRMTPHNVERSRVVIGDALNAIEARITGNRRFLIGNRLTVADISACSLLAPLAAPEQHPVYGSQEYRELVGPIVSTWTQRPALEWVRDTYRRQRVPKAKGR
jgi:glutathione S-transferase